MSYVYMYYYPFGVCNSLSNLVCLLNLYHCSFIYINFPFMLGLSVTDPPCDFESILAGHCSGLGAHKMEWLPLLLD